MTEGLVFSVESVVRYLMYTKIYPTLCTQKYTRHLVVKKNILVIKMLIFVLSVEQFVVNVEVV